MGCLKNNIAKRIFPLIIVFPILIFHARPVSAEIFAIHYSSYKTSSQAGADAGRLKTQGYEAFVNEANVPGSGKWFRVYAGKYSSRQKAIEAGGEMKRKHQIDKVLIHQISGERMEPEMKTVKQAPIINSPAASGMVVVGNKTSKRYHLPGMPFYNKVKAYHRVLFSSEQEAIEKGYYKAGTRSDAAREEAKLKLPGGKEDLRTDPTRKLSEDPGKQESGRKKEIFKALLMGNEKLLPPPPKLLDAEKSTEEVFKEPDEKNVIEPLPESVLYSKALGELKDKKYDQALITFKEFVARGDTGKEWGQRALRHMADCHYWLGKEGRKENLLIAAEFYKNTLENFPDPRRENALTYYRLAKTYEHLKYYPESIKQYQNLIAKYPDAPFVPEAYYNIGEIYYADGKYDQASEALIRYLMKYRGGVNAKKSFYLIAHSFYKAKHSANAEVWFREAQKKWPSMKAMPKELVLDYGFHKISMRRFDEAAGAFSFYANLYPDDDRIKEVLALLASAYRQGDQFRPALAVYDRIIEKYPGSREADESILAMASLGVDQPGIKAFRFLNHIHYYKDPMDAYDTLIMKKAAVEITEEAILQKAAALVKKGQGRKAADVYLDFLRQYPQSKKAAEAARGLKTASGALIDEYYSKKDYLAVAYVYFKSYGAVVLQYDEYHQINKIALSLKELGFIDEYLSILNRYLQVAGKEPISDRISMEIAEGLVLQGKYDEAQNSLIALAAKPSVKKSALITEIRKNLAEIAYRRKQYDQAVINYDAVVRSGHELSDPGRVYTNYARSLTEQKESAQALQNYLIAMKYLNRENQDNASAGITYKEIGDLYLKSNNLAGGLDMYNKAIASAKDSELKLWSQFMAGETYLKMNRDDQAQNVFAQIKAASGPEGFWTKVVDFYMADAKWWDKYGGMVKK